MGRPRSVTFDLPPNVQRKGQSYYFVVRHGGNRLWLRLGQDKSAALERAEACRVKYDRDPQDVGLRDEAMRRNGFACVYCGATDKLGIDHVVPLSRGGDNTLANIVVACRSCNSRKNATHPQRFVERFY